MSDSDRYKLQRHLNSGGALWESSETDKNQSGQPSYATKRSYKPPTQKAKEQVNQEQAKQLQEDQRKLDKLNAEQVKLEGHCEALVQELKQIRQTLAQLKPEIEELEASIAKQKQKMSIPQTNSNDPMHFRALPKVIDKNFAPSGQTLEYLIEFKRINPEYIKQKLLGFRLYWQERAEARVNWQAVFRQNIEFQWQKEQQRTLITSDFTPTESTLTELWESDQVDNAFALGLKSEFVSYFQELGYKSMAWQATFKKYVRQQFKSGNHKQKTAPRSTLEELTDTSWATEFQFTDSEKNGD